MIRLRLIGTIGLGALFTAVTIGYSFFQPFSPDAVLKAIPERATFVYQADHLEDLLKSPVCSQIDKSLGAGNTLRDVLAENKWTRLAAASEMAVADISYRSVSGSRSWAAVSWVGWRSPWLRWKLERAEGTELDFLGKHAIWPVWKYKTDSMANGMSITCSLTDNLFIICLSEHPGDIMLLLDTYDRMTPQK